jgi:hypothetical protein
MIMDEGMARASMKVTDVSVIARPFTTRSVGIVGVLSQLLNKFNYSKLKMILDLLSVMW